MSFFRGLTTGKWLMRFWRSAVDRNRIFGEKQNINHFTTFGRSAWRSACQKIEKPKEKHSRSQKNHKNIRKSTAGENKSKETRRSEAGKQENLWKTIVGDNKNQKKFKDRANLHERIISQLQTADIWPRNMAR